MVVVYDPEGGARPARSPTRWPARGADGPQRGRRAGRRRVREKVERAVSTLGEGAEVKQQLTGPPTASRRRTGSWTVDAAGGAPGAGRGAARPRRRRRRRRLTGGRGREPSRCGGALDADRRRRDLRRAGVGPAGGVARGAHRGADGHRVAARRAPLVGGPADVRRLRGRRRRARRRVAHAAVRAPAGRRPRDRRAGRRAAACASPWTASTAPSRTSSGSRPPGPPGPRCARGRCGASGCTGSGRSGRPTAAAGPGAARRSRATSSSRPLVRGLPGRHGHGGDAEMMVRERIGGERLWLWEDAAGTPRLAGRPDGRPPPGSRASRRSTRPRNRAAGAHGAAVAATCRRRARRRRLRGRAVHRPRQPDLKRHLPGDRVRAADRPPRRPPLHDPRRP